MGNDNSRRQTSIEDERERRNEALRISLRQADQDAEQRMRAAARRYDEMESSARAERAHSQTPVTARNLYPNTGEVPKTSTVNSSIPRTSAGSTIVPGTVTVKSTVPTTSTISRSVGVPRTMLNLSTVNSTVPRTSRVSPNVPNTSRVNSIIISPNNYTLGEATSVNIRATSVNVNTPITTTAAGTSLVTPNVATDSIVNAGIPKTTSTRNTMPTTSSSMYTVGSCISPVDATPSRSLTSSAVSSVASAIPPVPSDAMFSRPFTSAYGHVNEQLQAAVVERNNQTQPSAPELSQLHNEDITQNANQNKKQNVNEQSRKDNRSRSASMASSFG